MLDHSCQVQRAPLSERGDDFYATPPVAVEALLQVERLPRLIWEPACGDGAIVNVLRAAGYDVAATDLVDRGCPDSAAGIDFLMEHRAPAGVQCIVTNPPFKLAEEFVVKALDLCPRVIMLLRLAFLESERRSSILDCGRLARVHCFSRRIPMMHRGGYEGKKIGNSGMAFAWFVWNRDHRGPTEAMSRMNIEQRDLIIALAKAGTPPIEIVRKLADCYQRVGLETVRNVITYERSRGRLIPRCTRRGAPIVMPDVKASLREHATRRRMTVRALAREIITTVVASGMVDAVLDDGVQP
ncbi:hypothetical protein [Rhodoplanes elegans]|uniref:hypothetical protein n=1 Tax=Rhodoplanes elegans TaxID=29408 RepID=UPI001912C191|nr:hypothetical protein [Rhodoplanes elegans]